jgi:hypothetical protein
MSKASEKAGRAGVRAVLLPALLVLAGLLCGCAPVWTNLKMDKDVGCDRPVRDADIPYDCIEGARDELIGLQISAGKYNRGLAYTAVAGGTYAGYQSARSKPNTALLKHAAIGVAALMGFDSIVNADQQITTLDAGIAALDCVRKAADAVESDTVEASGSTTAPAGATPQQAARQVVQNQQQTDLVQQNATARQLASDGKQFAQIEPVDVNDMQAKVAAALGGAPPAPVVAPAPAPRGGRPAIAVPPAPAPVLASGLQMLVVAKANHLNAAGLDWNKAAVAARSNAPLRVYNAVLTIRQEVRRQLMLNTVDFKSLYKAQKDAVGQLIGELAATAQTQTKVADSLETVMGADLDLEKANTASKDALDNCAVDLGE